MKVLPSDSACISILKPVYPIIIISFITINVNAQDYPYSLGPAPVQEYKVSTEPTPFAIGTRAFTQLSYTPSFQFGKSFMETCLTTNIGAPFVITFPGGLIYADGIVYTWNQSAPYQVWAIDTVTGVHTIHLSGLTGVPQVNLTGMCWDGVTMYGVSSNLTASQLFKINWTTGVCTPIGSPAANVGGAINLMGRIGPQYSLFSCDIVLDNLYKWNKSTGIASVVGPITPCNFGQDGNVDPNDNKFYWMAYTTNAVLRILDTATGNSTQICSYSAQATGLACVPTGGPPPLVYCRSGLNVPIVDFQTARDSVFVHLSGSIILDVNVRIDTVYHTYDSDLRFYLQSSFVGVRIINWVGGSGDNFIRTILDDGATVPIANGTPPFSGTYIPSAPLAAFQGTSGPPSYYRLSITDTASGNTGFLVAWCIYFQYLSGGVVKTMEIPNYYFLNQNYPNPFNPTTIIKFGIPETENVKLIVYDVLGREVVTLLDEVKYPGTYEVDFDSVNLSSGIYFYMIETPNFVQVRKMLFVK